MAFPPAHMLVGVGVAEGVRSLVPLPRWRAWGVAAALAALPDGDFVLGLATGSATAYHGTFTHSIPAALAVALLAWSLAGPRWAALCAAGYGSHLLVDLLDDRGRTNVLLAWPFSEARPFAIARIFPQVPLEVGGGVTGAARGMLQPEALGALARQTLVAAGFLVALLLAAGVVRRRRVSRR